jgi:hypothetical protein
MLDFSSLRSCGLTARGLCTALALGAALGCNSPSSQVAETPKPSDSDDVEAPEPTALEAPPSAAASPQAVQVAPTSGATREVEHAREPGVRPERLTALREALRHSKSDLVVVPRSDGITQLRVERAWQSASVRIRKPDGQIEQTCIDSPEQLEHALQVKP